MATCGLTNPDKWPLNILKMVTIMIPGSIVWTIGTLSIKSDLLSVPPCREQMPFHLILQA